MKKVIFCLLIALTSSQTFAQAQQIVYGTVRYDGFGKITKGAFWSKRPEAKIIYEGGFPQGCTVYTLEQDYFVRFVDAEHNSGDKNYIVFPAGEKVYMKNGKYFAAICGNEIEFLKPVVQVQIVHDTVYIPQPVAQPQPLPIPQPQSWLYKQPQQQPQWQQPQWQQPLDLYQQPLQNGNHGYDPPTNGGGNGYDPPTNGGGNGYDPPTSGHRGYDPPRR